MRKEISTVIEERAEAQARDEALNDADSVAEWLNAECYMAKPIEPAVYLRTITAEDLASRPVSYLLALLLDAGQSVMTTIAARDALAERFLAQPGVKARVEAQAAQIALGLDEDERCAA